MESSPKLTEDLKKKYGLVGIKDLDLIILSELNDNDLLSFCNIDKYTNELCKNEDFWKKRFLKKFGNIRKDEKRTWRDFYLKIVFYTNKYQTAEEVLSVLSQKGLSFKSDLIDYFYSLVLKNYDDVISQIMKK